MTNNTKINLPILLESQFHKGFRWAVFGSAIYESAKTLHNILLTYYLTPKDYGLLASTLSLIYLVTKLADLGASTSLLPFFHLIIKSKQNFKHLILRFYLIPHIPILFLISVAAPLSASLYNFKNIVIFNNTNITLIAAISAIIFLETIRSFLRLFLYTSLECKKTVSIDVCSFLFYISIVWVPYFLFSFPLTIKNLLVLHIFDSLIVTIIFSSLFYKIYNDLPDNELSLPNRISSRIFKTKVFNYLLRLSRELFTSNFLTPFFAIKFGLENAGLFYLASVIAHSIQSIFKISVGYMGNAILANLKNSSNAEKQRAFELLTQKLFTLISPFLIILIINYKQILLYANCSNLSLVTICLAFLFLTIQIIDFIISLYEQFYVMEEASHKFFCYKIIEFIVFYLFLTASKQTQSLPTILLGIISIKLLSFAIIALSAYYKWQIKPKFKVNLNYITLSVVLALLAFLAFSIF